MKPTFPYIFGLLLFVACTKENEVNDHAEHNPVSSTHPVENSTDLMLTETQVKLANITTQQVTKKTVGQTVVLNGRLTTNEEQTQAVSSRAAGRIEKLYVKETGQPVKKGEPLYVIYSEELLTLQQEYLLAKEQYETLGNNEKRYKSFLDAAERKLILYGLTKNQINLISRNTVKPNITFLAPSSGVVTSINVAEGQYVAEGQLLYNLEDLKTLWVEAELYPNELSLVKTGDNVKVSTAGESANTTEATITFLSPEYRSNSQITIMRAIIENPELVFKPGQQVQVFLTHSSKEAVALPVDAVIRNAKGAHVYIQTGNNTFAPRMVKTGIENFDQVEITEGINEGDTVAISGAYLLYSEIILKKGTDQTHHH
ncbi:efflux RND transporter periplasmic adaptor subunit [Chryseosolibacter indicus]|uniref:Efflux RND transporter periplasmic adaptor subunit n=1 Tax=Chryseosolibacter indicus TaxID=2782351 RepID=A0ABS5VL39_9BACT|nr:efflux RND transporter periplasmic adaptor subunit [Chryseosolibacter indicus]MBT1701708.1 efflux RND transporter periplasmic adaptor subunit [Chryseosolibacter indicus]